MMDQHIMHRCDYCDMYFSSRKLLLAHQKTKKCAVHRHISFTCDKCFASMKGYENILNHASTCTVQTSPEDALIESLKSTLNVFGCVIQDGYLFDGVSGCVKFDRHFVYEHVDTLSSDELPTTMVGCLKKLEKYSSGDLGTLSSRVLNDVRSKVLRVSNLFCLESIRSNFCRLMTSFWLSTFNASIRKVNDTIHVLDRVQCRNAGDGRKWYGDTATMKSGEGTVVKCVWRRDPDFKKFYGYLKPLIVDMFDMYMKLGARALKRKGVSSKSLRADDFDSSTKLIADVIKESGLANLADNLTTLGSYERFRDRMSRMTFDADRTVYSNVENVFEKSVAPSSQFDHCEICSLMDLRDHHDLVANRIDYHLVYAVLPAEERAQFVSKE